MIQLTMECCLVMQLADDANSECCTTCSDQAAVAILNPDSLVSRAAVADATHLQLAMWFHDANSECCTFRSAQQTLLHTDPFTHKPFYTQTILHRRFYIQKLLQSFTHPFSHKIAFTHTRAKGLRADLQNRNFTSVFDTRPSFRAKGLRANLRNRNFTTRLDIKTYESEQSAANAMSSYKKYHFTAVLDDRSSFCAKGLPPRE